MSKFPYREAVGAHVDENDDTVVDCVRGMRCGQVLENPWTGALQKDGDVEYTLPASRKRERDHVR